MCSNVCQNNSSDDSSDWSSAQELDESDNEFDWIMCLFCTKQCENLDIMFAHLISQHDFDLINVCKQFHINGYQYIKLLNYMRHEKPNPNKVIELIGSKVYDSEEFLKPVLIDDQMLMFDIESELEANNQNNDKTETNDNLSKQELIEKLTNCEQYVKELENQLKDMKSLLITVVSDDKGVTTDSRKCDDYYISSYSHYSIHYDMLNDKSRTDSYKNAILNNWLYFEGKTVLDIGCGTGILSLFAAKAGARLVVGVDQSDVIYQAMDIVRENKLNDKIKLIKSKVESIDFSHHNVPDKYDIIISEWMGYFLLFEGMLDTILYARDSYLERGGVLMPNQCLISIAGISDKDSCNKYLTFWGDVYDFKMSCMKNEVIKEAFVESVSKDSISTSVSQIKFIDLMLSSIEEIRVFESQFQLICKCDDPIIGIVGWFDCHFNIEKMQHNLTLSTSPYSEDTHWKQTVFFLKNPLIVAKGDTVEGNIKVYRSKSNIRSLDVEIKIVNYDKQLFHLS